MIILNMEDIEYPNKIIQLIFLLIIKKLFFDLNNS
jgi:hypothetical protein